MHTEKMNSANRKITKQWLTEHIRTESGECDVEFPEDMLPTTGVVVIDDNSTLLAIGVILLNNETGVSMCGWVVANPQIRPQKNYIAMNMLLASLPEYAREFGAKYLMTTFGNRVINRILDGSGYFVQGDRNVEHKFMKLR
jgi:hypothetical protein